MFRVGEFVKIYGQRTEILKVTEKDNNRVKINFHPPIKTGTGDVYNRINKLNLIKLSEDV